MNQNTTNVGGSSRPWHLWLIGIVSLIWNAFGAFDFLATQFHWEPYMSNFTEVQLEYFYGLPVWQVVGWALGVWCALFGSIALLLARRIAILMFALSLLGMLVGMANYLFSDLAREAMGQGGLIFTGVIVLIGVGLLFYARAMAKQGVLR